MHSGCILLLYCFVRYYEDYEIDEVRGLSNITQLYIEVLSDTLLQT